MKTAIVYYTLEGHARKVAQAVAEKLGSTTLFELRCKRPYATTGAAKYLRASKDTLAGLKPELEPIDFDASAFDLVVIAAPCWAGKPAAPVNTFLAEHDLAGVRRGAIITCKAEGALRKYAEAMRERCGLAVGDPVLAVCERQLAEPTELAEAVATFCERCEG